MEICFLLFFLKCHGFFCSFFGEYLIQPSAPVIRCEVRCLGTQIKPTPKGLAEGSSEHTARYIVSSFLIILHAFWVNEIIHFKCQAKPSVVWDLVVGVGVLDDDDDDDDDDDGDGDGDGDGDDDVVVGT